MTGADTLGGLLVQRAEAGPDRVGYEFLDERGEPAPLTYGALADRAAWLADRIAAETRPGDRVLLCLSPGPAFLAGLFACFHSGRIAVPMMPPRFNQRAERWQAVVEDCAPALALVERAEGDAVRERFQDVPVLRDLRWSEVDLPADLPAQARTLGPATAHSVALLQYTSGSTGRPKGVVLRHRNLLANLQVIHDRFAMTPDTRSMVWLPPFHDMGLIGGVLVPLQAGAPITLMSPMKFLQRPERWLQAISRFRIEISGGPPFAYELCTERVKDEVREQLDLSSWRLAFCGAEQIPAALLERFTARFGPAGFDRRAFYPCYGLAEATLMVTGGRAGGGYPTAAVEGRTRVGCGGAVPGHQLRIADPESGATLEEGAVGEIRVRGPSVSDGYWGRLPEDPAGAAPELCTGDLGVLVDGALYVTGRRKEVLIVRGRNLHPEDLEQTVHGLLPFRPTLPRAVVSLRGPEEDRLVVVQEVPRGMTGTEAESLARDIERGLTREHGVQPHRISLVRRSSIPRTTSGKVQRLALGALLASGQLPGDEVLRWPPEAVAP